MKFFLVATLAILLSQPAYAMSAQTKYKLYHRSVYYPVHVVAVVLTGPVVIITSCVQHFDDELKKDATENAK